MHRIFKKLLLGFLIWVIPFFVSFFVWDVEASAPAISADWFSALMLVSLAISFSLASVLWFKQYKKQKDIVVLSWLTGLVWFIELSLLDYIFLVTVFGLSLVQYWPIVFSYLGVLVLTGATGHILKRHM